MSKFEKESRYFVAKVKDVKNALTELEQQQLLALILKVDLWRTENNKLPLEVVCVEDDWPEYEKVWQMIEDRMAKRNDTHG